MANNACHSLVSGLRVPVVSAPMFLVSGPALVIAACQAGIVGAFPTTNARTGEQLEQWMSEIVETLAAARDSDPTAVIGPWCANLITHSSNSRLHQDLALVAKYKPPIVITALGSPKPVMEVVKNYGGVVIADVVNLTLARKAVDAGADGLACICAGAGGHTGHLSPFAFSSAVREFFDGLLIVGGAIADGAGVAGAIAAGADLIYMGTRFLPTEESQAVLAYKEMVVASGVDDLIVSAGITGTPASWLKPSLVASGLDPANLGESLQKNYDSTQGAHVNRWKDTWSAGQGLGTVRAIEPVRAVVDRLVVEYDAAVRRLAGRHVPTEART